MALADLDEGEKQAIGLASNLGKDVLLLVDDRVGRRVAEKLNIATTGLVGLHSPLAYIPKFIDLKIT